MIYLDCDRGVAGDMIVAALAGLGADKDKIISTLRPIAKVGFKPVKKKSVSALRFDVNYKPSSRDYVDLQKSMKSLKLSEKVLKTSLAVLKELAIAESKAHKVPLKKVHLHEAVDIVVDAVATSLALESLGVIDEGLCYTPISVGDIAPATMEIIKTSKLPIRIVSDREITTPTGVAILSVVGRNCVGSIPDGTVSHGAGTMDLEYPNVLSAHMVSDKCILETNVDDVTPECLSFMSERLMKMGALDVHIIPCMMKKGRFGFLVRVLTEDPEAHAKIIMGETGSLGVRVQPVLDRIESVREIGVLKVDINGVIEEAAVKYSDTGFKPEFDDLHRIALKHGKSFKEVDNIVRAKAGFRKKKK